MMGQLLRGGFVVEDGLEWTIEAATATLSGSVGCLGHMYVSVKKVLAIWPDGDHQMVQTFAYSYVVGIQNQGVVFRYDNAPHHRHPDAHHRHSYTFPGHERLTAEWVGEANWPTLAEVIHEAEDWYWAHRDQLSDPDGAPDLSRARDPDCADHPPEDFASQLHTPAKSV